MQLLKPIHTFYYNIEGSGLYLQRKIWGRFYKERSGLLLFIAMNCLSLHLYITVTIALALIAIWASYFLSKAYRTKSLPDKIENFTKLTPAIRWAYFIYALLMMVILPVLAVVLVTLHVSGIL